jgi:hypothetical protein
VFFIFPFGAGSFRDSHCLNGATCPSAHSAPEARIQPECPRDFLGMLRSGLKIRRPGLACFRPDSGLNFRPESAALARQKRAAGMDLAPKL